jgi:lambda family phage portal protein
MGLLSRMLGGLPGLRRPPERRVVQMPVQRLRARYDAAQTTTENSAHWMMADPLAPDSAMSPSVRRTLRNRARYERDNNSYAKGMVLTLANDVVGLGPRIKVKTASPTADRLIEQLVHDWFDQIELAGKLRTLRQSQCVDGEAFAILVNNGKTTGVQLDLRLVEADQVATPTMGFMQPVVDGIEFDEWGNPAIYHLLKSHPGSLYGLPTLGKDDIPADKVAHLFRADRPAQHRGVPELTPALPLFAMLRRYTMATLSAAETAADFAAVLFTNAPANELPDVEPFVPLNIQPRSMMALPEGWQLGQMQSEQPTTTYGAFKTEILNEIARCLNMPFNVAACNSSAYNYSSGRLDHQVYFRAIRIDRDQYKTRLLDPLFRAWAEEAAPEPGLIPDGAGPISEWDWNWVWDGQEHVDPQSEAAAQQIRLESNTTTLADEYAKLGQDWEVKIEQRALELKKLRGLGMLPEPAPMPPVAAPPGKAPVPVRQT